LPKLFTTIDIAERQILSLQRFTKRTVEREKIVPLVEQAGLDPVEAGVRLYWWTPKKPEISVSDLIKSAELNLIRTDEFRNIVRGLGWEVSEAQENGAILPQDC